MTIKMYDRAVKPTLVMKLDPLFLKKINYYNISFKSSQIKIYIMKHIMNLQSNEIHNLNKIEIPTLEFQKTCAILM